MATFCARVETGRSLIDGSADLPKGTKLTRAVLEDDDGMTDHERADLEEQIERGRAAIAAGRGISGDELLALVRES